MAIRPEDWVRVIDREYIARFIKGGGSAVKFAVGSDDDLERVDADLAEAAGRAKVLTLRIDSTATRIHLIQYLFFAISDVIDWNGLAQQWMEARFKERGYTWPHPGEPVPVRELADHNHVSEILLRKEINEWLTAGIFNDYAMAQDFRSAMAHLCLTRLEPHDPLSSPPVIEWLKGELRTIGPLKNIPIGAKITRNNGRAMLRSLCRWTSLTRGAGIVVRLDLRHVSSPSLGPNGEARYSPSAVLDVFEVLRQCIDDSDSLEGLLLVCLAGEALVEG